MEKYYIQLTTLLPLLCGNFMFGFAPLLILKIASWLFCREHFIYTRNLINTVLLVFGGGVFMSTSLLVLVPQTRNHYEAFERSHQSSEESTSHAETFPIPEFIVLCGFFATFAIEELLHYILYHFHTKKTNVNDLRVRFCSCAKRHTECSRTFKADVPDQTLFGLEEKNSAPGLEYSEFSRPYEEATNITTNLLIPQSALPNYGAVGVALDDKLTNTPVSVLPPIVTDDVVQQTQNDHTSRNMFLLAIVCCHAFLQGIDIGFIPETLSSGSPWRLLLILCLQQMLLTFVIGNIGLSISKQSMSLFFVFVMSAMSPAGIGLTMLLYRYEVYSVLVLGIVKGLLCGSLLYFTFYDLLGRPSVKNAPHFSNFVSFSLGTAAVALLLYVSQIVES
ncbi:hypothetical protein JTE90_010706 [Oedothorax gibbosus]|uniref:Zinc transporter ZIP1 n=1 Tax=Oedothorax gibbosus TaxID=931172 RepID=A0AAV6UQB8_9ARAC|nr:hypothetical protein JTE90_010706 [Oedothorax gibbosus]